MKIKMVHTLINANPLIIYRSKSHLQNRSKINNMKSYKGRKRVSKSGRSKINGNLGVKWRAMMVNHNIDVMRCIKGLGLVTKFFGLINLV